jgi:rubrerythrin
MFCPKCAADLVEQDRELTCSASKMGFSRAIGHALLDRYGGHVPSANLGVASITLHAWYCPGCGVILDSEMRCPSCRLPFRFFEYSI